MSFQNLILLQNLYRIKSLGFDYSDSFYINEDDFIKTPINIDELKKNILSCHLCDLSKSRTQSMVGFGNENADIMIIDYTVSKNEDIGNKFYTGKSGEILKKICQNVLKESIENIYFTHFVKCKPLNSNTPSPSECNSCKPYLLAQIEFIKPKIIITLGKESYKNLTGDATNFEDIRGHMSDFKNYKILPIYHPNYLLRNPESKKTTFNDLNTIKRYI